MQKNKNVEFEFTVFCEVVRSVALVSVLTARLVSFELNVIYVGTFIYYYIRSSYYYLLVMFCKHLYVILLGSRLLCPGFVSRLRFELLVAGSLTKKNKRVRCFIVFCLVRRDEGSSSKLFWLQDVFVVNTKLLSKMLHNRGIIIQI